MTQDRQALIDHSINLLPGCQSSFRLSDGSVFSFRASMSGQEWTRECMTVAGILEIPPEQHQAMHVTEYVAKVVKHPHRGLLGDYMIYWLTLEFNPSANRSLGTLMASVYPTPSDPGAHREPYILYLEGYDASYVAWAKMEQEGQGVGEDEARRRRIWEKVAKMLLNQWRSGISQRMHQIKDDIVEV